MADKTITSTFKEMRVFDPPQDLSRTAYIRTREQYDALYKESIEHPERFWAKQAEENLVWFQKWQSVLEFDFKKIGRKKGAFVRYFDGGRLNVSVNCLDRHLKTKTRSKTAILWQGEKESDRRSLTYEELHEATCRFAQALHNRGIQKGDVVTLFMPMIPEAAIAMLACSRIGAIHSVVFSAFSADALKNRIQDCQSKFVVTADIGYHAGKVIPLKKKVDDAITECPSVKGVIVYNRGNTNPPMHKGRDFWWDSEVRGPGIKPQCEAVPMGSEDPLYILYTSGSTGKPKGVLHTTAGYLLQAHLTFKWIFDAHEDAVHFCTADVGWVTGHSYVVYGPLSNGVTTVMFEGVPTFPEPDRFWKIIQDYKVTIFYTAPTAIRALMRLGREWADRYDLSSLRVLGSVGEPINPQAWIWYYEVIGRSRCPVADTWWQTETGGIMITPLAGALRTKPGSASMPFFGVEPEVLRPDGKPVDCNEGGSLVIKKPWPGMIRGVYGDQKNELIQKTYFSAFEGKYFTGDGCRIDADGFYWLLGRIDDVINVSAHRFATAEIESSFVSHPKVSESAVVGFPHDIKGQGIHCFVTLKADCEPSKALEDELRAKVRNDIGPIATPDRIQFTTALPKTRSGKIMRRILRKIAEGDIQAIGDTSTLADPSVVERLVKDRAF